MNRVLCSWSDLDRTGAKEIVIDDAGIRVPVFVVRRGEDVFGYFNACPHVRLPLNWQEDVFFDVTRSHLLCANHGAHFEVDTGRCIRGPCKGKSLRSFQVRREDEKIICDDSAFD